MNFPPTLNKVRPTKMETYRKRPKILKLHFVLFCFVLKSSDTLFLYFLSFSGDVKLNTWTEPTLVLIDTKDHRMKHESRKKFSFFNKLEVHEIHGQILKLIGRHFCIS